MATFLKIPIEDCTITQAAAAADDGDLYYLQTMPSILHLFPAVTRDSYWQLSVAEHGFLAEFASDYASGMKGDTDG